MTNIEEFLKEHHQLLVTSAPEGASQHVDLPYSWAIKMPFHKYSDGSSLSLVVYLDWLPGYGFKMDYRLQHNTPTGGQLQNVALGFGEFSDLRDNLIQELANNDHPCDLADEPGAHRMFYYIEEIYWELASAVTFNALVVDMKTCVN